MPAGGRSSVDAAAQAAIHEHDELEKKSRFDLDSLILQPDGPEYVATTTCSDVLTLSKIFTKHGLVYVEQLDRQLPTSADEFARAATGKAGSIYYLPRFGGRRPVQGSAQFTITIWGLKVDETTQTRWYVTDDANASLSRIRGHVTVSKDWARHAPGDGTYESQVNELRVLMDHPYLKPQAEAITKALALTDWSCFIEDAETAWDRVMTTPYIYHNAKEPFRDMTNDRYILELEPAKRLLASIVHMSAAHYLLFKRNYFKAFYRDLVHNRDKIPVPVRTPRQCREAEAAAQQRRDQQLNTAPGQALATPWPTPAPPNIQAALLEVEPTTSIEGDQAFPANDDSMMSTDSVPAHSTRSHVPIEQRMTGAEAVRQLLRAEEDASTVTTTRATPQRGLKATQVRSDKNHIDAIRAQLGFTWTNARLIQEGWKAMGILNEENYVDWLDGGGQLETIGLWED